MLFKLKVEIMFSLREYQIGIYFSGSDRSFKYDIVT